MLKQLARWFLSSVFKEGKIPAHILMRDYARGVIEVAIKRRAIAAHVRSRISPPYGSKWPKKIPTEKALRKLYRPEQLLNRTTKERGFLDIWSSVMYNFHTLGDFGNYRVNSELRHWSGRRLGGKQLSRKNLFDEFKKSLTATQLELLNKTNPFYGVDFIKIQIAAFKAIEARTAVRQVSPDELKNQKEQEQKDRELAISQFKRSLTAKQRVFFEKQIEPYLDQRGIINDPLDHFDTSLGQRWIFKRVVELGWNPKLHGEFDENINRERYDRSEHKAERIGKKYQWIALHELLGLVADNFEFIGERSSDETSSAYDGAWQIGVRDIDPSCTLRDSSNEPGNDLPIFDSYMPSYNAWKKTRSLRSWLRDAKQLPNAATIIEMIDDDSHVWLVLEGHCQWQEETPPEYERYQLPTRTLYYMFKSYLVKNDAIRTVFRWSKKQRFYGRWMPESHAFYNVFLAEYPSYPAFLHHYQPYYHHDEWSNRSHEKSIPAPLLVTDDEYHSSGSSIDCSTNETLSVKLAAKWIVDKMGLIQKCTDGRFFDSAGDLLAFDPTVFTRKAPALLLIRKDKFLRFLKKENCSIIWTVLGEKQTIGGIGVGQPYGWQEIRGVYINKWGKLKGAIKSEFHSSR